MEKHSDDSLGNGRDKKCLEWRRNRSEAKGMGLVQR